MDENNVKSNTHSVQTSPQQLVGTSDPQQAKPASPSPEIAGSEHRQAYGTAKTENLRDSGAWRWILPGFVMLCCLAIFVAPLIIVVPLFINSLAANSATHNLIWLWVTMFVIEVAIAIFVIRGLLKIFLTQAGNY